MGMLGAETLRHASRIICAAIFYDNDLGVIRLGFKIFENLG